MAIVKSFLQTDSDATDLSTYTFSSVNLGTADSDRTIVILVTGRSNDGGSRTLDSATIGGVSATINVQATSNGNVCAIISADVPTGSTGNVVLNFSSTMTGVDISTYRVLGMSGTTATDTGSSTASPLSDTLNMNAAGVCFAVAKNDNGSSNASWGNVTEDFDTTDAIGNDISGASRVYPLAESSLPVSCSWSSTITRPLMVAACFDAAVANDITFGNKSTNGSQGTTSWSHNSNGDYLFVAVNDTANTVTDVTFNGVSMNFISNVNFPTLGRAMSLWGLANPAAGSNTIAITGGANQNAAAVSMSGVAQSSSFSGVNSGQAVGTTPISSSFSTSVNNAFAIGMVLAVNFDSLGDTLSDVVRDINSDPNSRLIVSSIPVTPVGTFSYSVNMTGSNNGFTLMTSINPPSINRAVFNRRLLAPTY